MSRDSLIRYIRDNIPTSGDAVAAIAAQFDSIDIPAHHYFLETGNISKYMFLEQGYMRAFTYDVKGNEVTTHFYTPGQVVFEVASFFSRSRSRESIQALTECTGYIISFEQLNRLFHEMPEFREFGRAMLVKGFVALKQRTLSLINETAEERYAGLLGSSPVILQYAPLKHIATYLGITDTSLSRIRRAFAKKE